MPQVLVRNIDSKALRRLKARADRNGRSLEAELRHLLELVAAAESDDVRGAVDRLRVRFAGRRFRDSASLVRWDRNR